MDKDRKIEQLEKDLERSRKVVDITELQDKVKELETELYFCNRNKRIGEVVDERTKMETPKIRM